VHHPVVIDVIESDLLPMHVQTAYHRHQWDLLELLKNFSDTHIIERLSRGGPHHMSSFRVSAGALEASPGASEDLRARPQIHLVIRNIRVEPS